VAPVVIERITGPQGELLFEAPPAAQLVEGQRAIPARNAFLVSELLNEVTRSGTAARAQAVLGRPDLYGKTGTTNDAVDAWFAGWAGAPGHLPALASGLATAVVAVAWIGHDDPQSLGSRESGGGLSLPVWLDALRPVLRSLPVRTAVLPDGLVRVQGEWRYAEWAEGSPVSEIGLQAPTLPAEPNVPTPAAPTPSTVPATPAQATPPPAASWGSGFQTSGGMEGTGAGPEPLIPRPPPPARSGGR
jgi:penicillin-binding protein 1A